MTDVTEARPLWAMMFEDGEYEEALKQCVLESGATDAQLMAIAALVVAEAMRSVRS